MLSDTGVSCPADARLGKLVFGTRDKSGLPGAGSLVYIFSCIAGVSECLRKKKESEKKKIYRKVSTFSFEREKVMEES